MYQVEVKGEVSEVGKGEEVKVEGLVYRGERKNSLGERVSRSGEVGLGAGEWGNRWKGNGIYVELECGSG